MDQGRYARRLASSLVYLHCRCPCPSLAALALVCVTQGQAIARGLLAGAFSHLTLPHVGSLCICHTVVSDRPRADMLATTYVWRTTSTSPLLQRAVSSCASSCSWCSYFGNATETPSMAKGASAELSSQMRTCCLAGGTQSAVEPSGPKDKPAWGIRACRQPAHATRQLPASWLSGAAPGKAPPPRSPPAALT